MVLLLIIQIFLEVIRGRCKDKYSLEFNNFWEIKTEEILKYMEVHLF